MEKELATWGGRGRFRYEGSVGVGTTIKYGAKGRQCVRREHYIALLSHFRGRTVDIGTSRDNPPESSVVAWLQEHVTKAAIASYVGAILVAEGYAEKVSPESSRIRFQ